MPAISVKPKLGRDRHSEVALLVRETRHRLGLSQVKFAAALGVSFQSVNRWENGRTQPLPVALKQLEHLLLHMGEQGKDLLTTYFPTRGAAE